MTLYDALLRSMPSAAFKLNVAGTGYNDITGNGNTLTGSVRTNLCTNQNFETGVSDWVSTSTMSRDTSVFYSGVASIKTICDGTATYQGLVMSGGQWRAEY